jgi:proteasome lid subunit RPN8/RPN11
MEDSPMLTLSDEVYEILLDEAKRGYPYEIGGLLIKDSEGVIQVMPCKNSYEGLEDALDYFMLDSSSIARAELLGVVLAVYHSHPCTPVTPSEADYRACYHSDLPMVIINPLTEEYSYTTPEEAEKALNEKPRAELIGRPFIWGTWDCLGLASDIYAEYLGIEIPYFDRGLLYAWDYDMSWDKFTENFANAGFKSFPTPRNKLYLLEPFDVLLMNVGGSKNTNPNHCGVLMNTETMEFWHHLANRPSGKSIFRSQWVDSTVAILRHESRL